MAGGFVVWSGAFGSAGLCTVSGGYAPVDNLLFQGSVRGFCACPGNELQKRSAIGRFFRWIGAFSDQKNALS